MAESSAGHLGYGNPESRYHGCYDERCLVSHTTRAVLVDIHSFDSGKIEHFTAFCHKQRQLSSFFDVHPVYRDGHKKRRRLIIGYRSVSVAIHKKRDLFL